MPSTRMAPDRWGSKPMRAATNTSSSPRGSRPSLRVLIFSRFLEMNSAKKTITPTFATSEGWNCPESMPGTPSHRVALLRVMPTPGMSTSTSRTTETMMPSFARPRKRS